MANRNFNKLILKIILFLKFRKCFSRKQSTQMVPSEDITEKHNVSKENMLQRQKHNPQNLAD